MAAAISRQHEVTRKSHVEPGRETRAREDGTSGRGARFSVALACCCGLQPQLGTPLQICGKVTSSQICDKVGSLPSGIVVRTTVEPASIASAVRQAIWSVDKNQPVWRIRTPEEIVDRQLP